jgi:hypothetical protein
VYRYYSRQFLNLRGHHGGAYVLAVVEALRPGEEDASWARELTFELSDCSRRVLLDFPLMNAADRRNSLRKARLLADVTARFAEALAVEAEIASTR